MLELLLQPRIVMLAAQEFLRMLELLLQPRIVMLALEAKGCNRC